ncbi:MAG: hypothetical protein KBA40_00245 [Candidatus Peribacteraceae bacterium]|nr:hypothetical protein [Candidatus Peribacteraceae bacterium]
MIVLAGILLPMVAHAQYHLSQSGWDCSGFLYCTGPGSIPPADVVVLITLKIVLGVSAFIAAIAIIAFFYGAIRMVISQGQEGKEAGKKALIWASFGLAASLLVGAVIQYITDYIYLIP